MFCSRTFFVPFGTFFAHDSTPPRRTTTTTTTTTKLLLGPLSGARGQKETKLPYLKLKLLFYIVG